MEETEVPTKDAVRMVKPNMMIVWVLENYFFYFFSEESWSMVLDCSSFIFSSTKNEHQNIKNKKSTKPIQNDKERPRRF